MKGVIRVTRLNDQEFYINPDLIEFIEETPDTVLSLTTGKKIVVREEVAEVIRRIIEFRRAIMQSVTVIRRDAAENLLPEGEG